MGSPFPRMGVDRWARRDEFPPGDVDGDAAGGAVPRPVEAADGGSCCDVKGFPKDPLFEAGVGAGLRKEDTELKAKVDAGIVAVYKSGEFDAIQKKYFKYDVGTPPKS